MVANRHTAKDMTVEQRLAKFGRLIHRGRRRLERRLVDHTPPGGTSPDFPTVIAPDGPVVSHQRDGEE